MSEVKLASNWTKTRVLDCWDEGQKHELIRFLDERYRERFLNPIGVLRETPGSEQGFGFAIMSLCCLLIETMQCYRMGLPSSHARELSGMAQSSSNTNAPGECRLSGPFTHDAYNSQIVFERFFGEPKHQTLFPGVGGCEFYRNIRCGLLHQAQTKGTWRIVRVGRFWDENKKAINRDEFAQRLEECFENYLAELAEDDGVWLSAGKKIWWLAELS
jgi:hypothetical protein